MSPPPRPQPTINDLADMLPARRIATLLRLAGGDGVRALELHRWNERMGLALFLPLQRIELGLRTRVSRAFSDVYGPLWFSEPRFRGASSYADRKEIAEASRRLMLEGLPVDAEGLLEKASFGLWVGLLRPGHNPAVWSGRLRATFPAMPTSAGRGAIADLAIGAAWLRNRVGHHELLICLDLSARNARLLQLLDWLDPTTAAEVRADNVVQKLLRAKP